VAFGVRIVVLLAGDCADVNGAIVRLRQIAANHCDISNWPPLQRICVVPETNSRGYVPDWYNGVLTQRILGFIP